MAINVVNGMLGHYSAGFTLDTYAHVITAAPEKQQTQWQMTSPLLVNPDCSFPRMGHNMGQSQHLQNSPQILQTFHPVNHPEYTEKPPFSEENGGNLVAGTGFEPAAFGL